MSSEPMSESFHSARSGATSNNPPEDDFAPLSPHGPLPPSLSAGNRLSMALSHSTPDFLSSSPYSSPPHSPRDPLTFLPLAVPAGGVLSPDRASSGHPPASEDFFAGAYDPPRPGSSPRAPSPSPFPSPSTSRDPSPSRSATYPPPAPALGSDATGASPLRASWTAAVGRARGRYSLASLGEDGEEARKGLLPRDQADLGLEWNRSRAARQRRYLTVVLIWISLLAVGIALGFGFKAVADKVEVIDSRKAKSTESSASSVASVSYASYMSSYYASLSSAEGSGKSSATAKATASSATTATTSSKAASSATVASTTAASAAVTKTAAASTSSTA